MQKTKFHQKVSWLKLAIASILTIAASGNFVAPATAIHYTTDACHEVEFVFARGSGESLDDKSYRAWHDNIETALAGIDLDYDFYELGTRAYGNYQYPATTVSGDAMGTVNMLGALFTSGEGQAFGASVEQGMMELRIYLDYTSTFCPQTQYVLGGYSQGAMVITKMLPRLDVSKIIYITTFGDPKLYLPEGYKGFTGLKTPDACRGVNLSDYRAYVSDCKAYEGVLNGQQPYAPTGYTGKIGTWCNQSDIMCSSGLSISDHTAYISENLYSDAAQYVREKVLTAFPQKSNNSARNLHDVAFLFDLTGSMSPKAKQYKAEALRLAQKVWHEGGRVALYGYRDLEDEETLRKFCDFSTCTEETFEEVFNDMRFVGGGDTAESLLSAANIVMRALNWMQGATKSLVVLTDAPYHSPDLDGTTLEQVVQLSLLIDPVNIYTITPQLVKNAYNKITQATNGQAFSIESELSWSTETIFNRPVAKLSLPAYSGVVGEEFWFDASDSYGFGDDELTFDWDLDGDGTFELINAGAQIRQTYNSEYDGFIKVRVNDEKGSSTMTATVTTKASTPETPATLQVTRADKTTETAVEIEFRTANTSKVLLTVDELLAGFIPLENGTGKIEITELADSTTIKLIPYSVAEQRGLPVSIEFQSDGLEIIESSQLTEIPPSTSTEDNSQKPTAAPIIGNPTSTTNNPVNPGSFDDDFVPKAPNTGVRKTPATSKL